MEPAGQPFWQRAAQLLRQQPPQFLNFMTMNTAKRHVLRSDKQTAYIPGIPRGGRGGALSA